MADPATVATAPAPGGAPELPGLGISFARLPGAQAIFHARVDRAQWRAACAMLHGRGARLVALWAIERGAADGPARDAIQAAFCVREGLLWLDLEVAHGARYPGLSAHFPCAVRMQRAAADLSGVLADDGGDSRPWLRHAAWPAGFHPLRSGAQGGGSAAGSASGSAAGSAAGAVQPRAVDEDYAFVRVEGDGVHEIGVGPVHAGIIEPGHFRFSVVGEKVLRLEERLGYVHKGIERLWRGMEPAAGLALAGRVSGDTMVAYGWAWSLAVESLCGAHAPARADWLRAFALERERVANHLGDLGALGNDAALAFGLAQFSRLKEDWLRRNSTLFGHRFARDWIVPGGVRADLAADALAQVRDDTFVLEAQVRELRGIYGGHAGLQDRFHGTGSVSPELARRLDLTGLAARASGIAADLRVLQPGGAYAALQVHAALRHEGDVAARVEVRFDELLESLRLLRAISDAIPAGAVQEPCGPARANARGAGRVEGWRGEVLVAIETDGAGAILRAHAHDPSWQNWPALEHAVIGNIVPDFPLINKSFNLSYSGHDL
jgi:Ni,Fe-hydrogenase III large subunit/Ni,Fe-hydrogenase III component G